MEASARDQIKEKLSITDVVGAYVKLERAGRNLRARCPFHKERTPSFNVSPERGSYYCFGCGEKGDIFTFTEKMEGVDFMGAMRILAEKAGVTLTAYRGEKGPSKDEKERLYELHEEAVRLYVDELAKREDVQTYLKGRGITDETIRAWKLGYASAQWRMATDHLRTSGFTEAECVAAGLSIRPEASGGKEPYDRFRGRIMFPIFDAGGRAIAFSGRFFEKMAGSKEEDPAKYVNSPETPLFHKSHVLYGLDRARGAMRRSDFAILVEGQMDLLMMHQSGFPNTVAGSGTALTEEHLKTIGHSTKRLVLALDADQAGMRSALRSAAMAFAQGYDLRIATFPEGKDPADVGRDAPEELRTAIRNAQNAVDFFVSYARAHTKDERAFRRQVEEDVLPLVAAMGSKMDQAHFIQVIARATDLPEDAIRAEVARTPLSPEARTEQSPPAPVVQAPYSKIALAGALILVQNPIEIDALKQRIGDVRYKEIEDILASDKEKFLFMKDSEEYSGASKEELYRTIDTTLLSEEIEETRKAQYEAERQGDEAKAVALASTLQALVRRRHGLLK